MLILVFRSSRHAFLFPVFFHPSSSSVSFSSPSTPTTSGGHRLQILCSYDCFCYCITCCSSSCCALSPFLTLSTSAYLSPSFAPSVSLSLFFVFPNVSLSLHEPIVIKCNLSK